MPKVLGENVSFMFGVVSRQKCFPGLVLTSLLLYSGILQYEIVYRVNGLAHAGTSEATVFFLSNIFTFQG